MCAWAGRGVGGVQGYDGADFGVFRYSYDPETQASQHSLTNNAIIADIRPRDTGQPALTH